MEVITELIGLLIFKPVIAFFECIMGLMKPLPPTPYVRRLRWLAIFFLLLAPLSFAGCFFLREADYSIFAALGSFLLSLISMSCAGWIGGKLIKLDVPEESEDVK